MMVAVYSLKILEETNYTIHCKNPEKHHLLRLIAPIQIINEESNYGPPLR
jgi:hypothetical protein